MSQLCYFHAMGGGHFINDKVVMTALAFLIAERGGHSHTYSVVIMFD